VKVPGIPFVQGRNRYADGDARKYGIAIHNTSNDASDSGEASYAKRRPDGVSSHFYVDADSVTQSIDTFDRAGHAGSTHGNDHGISVEITGGNGWSREKWLRSVAWDQLGRVLAAVIKHHWPTGNFQVRRASVAEMRANPRVRALYGHNDMRLAWGGTDHTDPGPNFPWDRLVQAISAALSPPKPKPDAAPVTPTKETDMQQSEKLVRETGYANRTVGHVLADVQNLRNALLSPPGATLNGAPLVPEGSVLDLLTKAAAQVAECTAAVRQNTVAVRQVTARLDGPDVPSTGK
jgi:N-acetyl-anhydromuramyl-L-alanine amidase AmpD